MGGGKQEYTQPKSPDPSPLPLDMENGHQLFQFNLAYMKLFCRAALELSDVQKKFAAKQSPYFSRLMSEACALSQTLALDVPLRAVVGAQIGRKGNRGKVFEDKTDKERVVKQLAVTVHPSEMRDEHLLGITRTLGRSDYQMVFGQNPGLYYEKYYF